MKSVITVVGTSLITNYIKYNDHKIEYIKNHYEKYLHLPAKEYEQNKNDIVRIKKVLIDFAENNIEASAEIKSITKLSEEISDGISIYLLSSDTVNSKICAEVIKEVCQVNEIQVYFSQNDIIKGLQVKDRKSFAEEGMENLFKRIEYISGGFYGNTIMNITGGYKASIPLLTIFSQINKIPSYYIFEDTDALIKIPCLPLSIDWDIFKTYNDIFQEVDKSKGGIDNWNKLSAKIKKEHQEIVNACFEIDGHYADLSTLGRLLWTKYKESNRIFYVNECVKSTLDEDHSWERYIKKLFDEKLRREKTENKNGHLVLDLGRTAPRIFYFQKNGYFYVYKYARHNDQYERFLNSPPKCIDNYGPFHIYTLKI